MGGASSKGGGGGDNKTYSTSREIGLMNQNKSEKKKKTVTGFDRKTGKKYSYETTVNQRAIDTQKDKNKAFKEQGAYNTRRSLDKLPSLGVGGIIKGLSPILQKNSKRNRDFFTNKVLTDPRGKKNFGYTKDEFQKLSMSKQNEIYGNYITTRRDNKTDGYGTVFNEGNDRTSDTQNKPLLEASTQPVNNNVTTAPSNAEVSQAQSTSMTQKDILLANKKKGRRDNLLTSAQGLGTNNLIIKKNKLGAA